MATYLYRLSFKGPAHFGAYGIGLEETSSTLSSDALTSSIINAFALLGKAEEAVTGLKAENRPIFILSSLFTFGPDKANQTRSYALPKPMAGPNASDPAFISRFGKALKGLRLLTPGDFVKWTGPEKLSIKDLTGIVERCGRLGQSGTEDEGAWFLEDIRTRVALDRDTSRSSVWRCGLIHFHRNAGLYGLVTFSDESWREPLTQAFKLLGEMGIGGERTYGMGSFDFSGFEPVPSDMMLPQNHKRVLLSSYYPSQSERVDLASRLLAWDLRQSRGYITTGLDSTALKKRTIRFLREGSVFKETVAGKFADVTPEAATAWENIRHGIYRSGLAFFLPVRGEGQ